MRVKVNWQGNAGREKERQGNGWQGNAGGERGRQGNGRQGNAGGERSLDTIATEGKMPS